MKKNLYRGIRKDNGEWAFGFPFVGETSSYILDAKMSSGSGSMFFEFDGVEVFPETVGQYTGRQCKNGKVFDGDIGKNIDGVFLVCWDEEKAAFVMRFLEYPFETLYLEEMYDDTEIIGNIHDNPELLLERKEECNT